MAELVLRKDLVRPVYYVRASFHGHRVWFSTKTDNRHAAKKIKAKTEVAIAEDRFLRPERSGWTLKQLSEVYLARMEKVRPRSAAWRRERFARILEDLGPDFPIENVTVEVLDGFVDRRLGAGRSASTVRGEATVLRHALRKAHRWKVETGLTEYRLADWEQPPLEETREPIFLAPAEVARLLAGASELARAGGLFERQGEAVIRLALETGARVSEIVGLRWRALDRTRLLDLKPAKRGLRRSIRLSRRTVALLGRLRDGAAGGDPIFPSEADTAFKDRYAPFWRVVREAAGLPHVRFQDLRHTFASEFLRRGEGDLRILQRILGHRTGQMTERYAHFAKSYRAPDALSWRTVRNPVSREGRKTGVHRGSKGR